MISIIPEDKTIVIDGISARALDNRVSAVAATDARAIQFHEEKGIGHIEFAYEYGDDRKGNKCITAEDIDIAEIKALHETLIAEEAKRQAEERAQLEGEGIAFGVPDQKSY